jgi:hypothetical protein
MCEVGSNKCDNTILLTLSNSTQYTMGHYTVKKSLNKSDDKKVGQRFISWENLLDPTPFDDAFKIIYTHLAWPFVAAALHNHSSRVASLKGGFINLNGVHLP